MPVLLPIPTIPRVTLQKQAYRRRVIPLTGHLVSAYDGATIGQNFKQLINLRYYSPRNIRGISGQTKINSTALSTYLKVRNAFHFRKVTPEENHLICHVWNADLTGNVLYQHTTAVPNTGNFDPTALLTPNSDRIGRFSPAPEECVVFCDGSDNYIWGGDEAICKGFINFDPNGTFSYDFTEQVTNTINDSNNRATLKRVAASLGATNVLCLHLNSNVTDSSPATPHTVTATDITYSTTDKVLGSASVIFNGSSSKLTIPDNADFDRSGGVWTQNHRVKVDSLAANRPLFYQATVLKSFTYNTGTHEPTVGQTLYGETSGAVLVVDKVENTGGWAGAGTGTIYYTATSGNVQNGEHIHEEAAGAGNLVCNTTSAETAAGSNYIKAYIDTNGAVCLVVYECYGAGSNVVSLSTANGTVVVNTWYFIEFVESGNGWYIFVGPTGGTAALAAYVSDTSRAKNYNGDVVIGYDNTTYLSGKLDEYTCWTSALHTAAFLVPLAEYGSSAATYLYLYSNRPISGAKFYIGTANATAATVAGYEWIGTGWSAVSTLTDGTAVSGKTMAQTGSISWDSTVSTSKVQVINGNVAYCYMLVFTDMDDSVTVYYSTLDAPFQPIVDIWDGIDRQIIAFYKYAGSPLAYNDFTLNVRNNSYDSADTSTYVEIDSLATTEALFIGGLPERTMGIAVNLIGGHVNTTANTTLTVYYSADGSTWTSVGTIQDGTSKDGISFAQSGTISWNPPSVTGEFMSQVSRSTPAYHYKLVFSQTLSADVQVFYVGLIPVQATLGKYKYPLMAQDRLMLCCDMVGKKHAMIHSAYETNCFWNGNDSSVVEFGESGELMGGCSLYSQYGSSIYNMVLQFKRTEMWKLVGVYPEWQKFQVDDSIGLAAPLTLKVVQLPGDVPQGLNRRVAIWQGNHGIYISDGRTPLPIHEEIKNYFDKTKSECISSTLIEDSTADVSIVDSEYVWRFASGSGATGINKELVFNFRYWKWYEVDRTTNKRIPLSVDVLDAYGNQYNYGFNDNGYMYRLDYGNTFDGEDITFTIEWADLPLTESDLDFLTVVKADFFHILMVADVTTLNKITYTHKVDTRYAGLDFEIEPFERDPSVLAEVGVFEDGSEWGEGKPAEKRIANLITALRNTPYGVFHSGKLVISTNNISVGFEPLALAYYYTPAWEKLT